MAYIIIGTTPTIKYKFNEIDPATITAAYLTIKRDDEILLKLPLSSADREDDALSWTLTQAQTLTVGSGTAKAMLNWKTEDGTRGASHETELRFRENHIAEVI